MDLGVEVSERDGVPVMTVTGEIDVYTAPQLRQKIIEVLLDRKFRIVLDLEGVDFIDSTGLGVLVGALKRARAHDGSVSLVCTKMNILRVFEITGLTKVFSMHPTVEAATS